MFKKRGNFYGILISFAMFAILIGLFLSDPTVTGSATKRSACFDGTRIEECSTNQPKFCDNGALKVNCQRCGCREGEVCQKDGSCLQKCPDGTLYGQCSENKPILCFKGSVLENCFKCGCAEGQTCNDDGSCSGIKKAEVMEKKLICGDGTLHGACSKEKPAYCENGRLTNNCFRCGCNAGETCGENGLCEPIRKCADGSIYGECSTIKPKFCQNGKLVDSCELCGCEQGTCSDGKCLEKLPKVGYFWNTFCKVFYYNGYDKCISDVARNQNK